MGARLRLGFHYHWDLRHPDHQVTVDLHWAFVFGFWFFPWRLEHVWDRLVPLSLAGTSVYTLPPEELLILLCLHGGKHHWKRIGWICDVAQVIRTSPQLDWDRVKELATRLRRQRSLWLGVELARQLLDAPVPQAVTAQLQADLEKALTEIIERSSALTSATIPSSRSAFGDGFYTAFFVPSTANPFWEGHLQAFRLNPNLKVVGTDDKAALDPVTFLFKEPRKYFWDAAEELIDPNHPPRTLYTTMAGARDDFNTSTIAAAASG